MSTLVAVQFALYLVLAWLSKRFEFDSLGATRPIPIVLGVFAVILFAYLACIPLSLHLGRYGRWTAFFFLVAVLFRGVMFCSEPIQEVDLYRYIWDGAVSGENVSPYRFSPADVLTSESMPSDPRLVRLAEIASEPGLSEVLRRVHYGQLPTVYPPVSQQVFRLANRLTPANADVHSRVRVMKVAMIACDLGVMLILYLLLRSLRMNPGWCIAYGWSPLVLKEFSNSGHLDAIAVFLVMAAILSVTVSKQIESKSLRTLLCLTSGILLAFAVGAKLYPIVLFPLLGVFVAREFGGSRASLWVLAAFFVTAASVAPMAGVTAATRSLGAGQTDQLQGLRTFIQHWEMNDLIFMVIEENIRPEGVVAGQPSLWFVVTPDRWRRSLIRSTAVMFGGDEERTPFLLTRLMTSIVFGLIAVGFCIATWRDPRRFHEAAFLTLAWFWFLAPTQNPWYWTWALPLVPFARNRVWLLVSGITMMYYARFWFEYHALTTESWGLAYHGTQIFDFVIVWFEFAPFLFALAILGSMRAYRERKATS